MSSVNYTSPNRRRKSSKVRPEVYLPTNSEPELDITDIINCNNGYNTFDLSSIMIDNSSQCWNDSRFDGNQSAIIAEADKSHSKPRKTSPIPRARKMSGLIRDTNSVSFSALAEHHQGISEITGNRHSLSSSRQIPKSTRISGTVSNESFSSSPVPEFLSNNAVDESRRKSSKSVRSIPKSQKFNDRFDGSQSTIISNSLPKIPQPIPLPRKMVDSVAATNNSSFYVREEHHQRLGEMSSNRSSFSSSRQIPKPVRISETVSNDSFSSIGVPEFPTSDVDQSNGVVDESPRSLNSVRSIPKPQKFGDSISYVDQLNGVVDESSRSMKSVRSIPKPQKFGDSISNESFPAFGGDGSMYMPTDHFKDKNSELRASLTSPKSIPKPFRISESISSNGSSSSDIHIYPLVPAKPLLRNDSNQRSIHGSNSSDDAISRLSHISMRSNGEIDFSNIPKMARPGGRTTSTAQRLEAQGFRRSTHNSNFPVKSIARGTESWQSLLKPFVADIAFRSLEYRHYQSEISFRPYTCQAAVLFVDLSNYSKITSEIAKRGAHAISNVVNAYLERILCEVDSYGGDVVKFAGDAVLIVWEGKEDELFKNVLAAASCAVKLQKNCGFHLVEGIDLQFRIHCGLSCGFLESEIFQAPNHLNMQRCYHSVGGESIVELSELVDMAKAGETCISEDCAKYLNELGVYEDVENYDGQAKLLTNLNLDEDHKQLIQDHIQNMIGDRLFLRGKHMEEYFIHPCVLNFLSHGGLSPTQIAQIRNLCVLFIAMTSKGSSVNWLMEVQSVLDLHRCPIVQIIDDDKGVHIIAAINLYESDPYASVLGLTICEILESKQVGCAIGMALGSTFCGVTGCSRIACRWDITGPPAVRAARLMQYALKQGVQMAIDQSVFDDPLASTRLKVLQTSVALKGSPGPVTVYTVSDTTLSSVFGILDTSYGRVHKAVVKQIENQLGDTSSRCCIIVTGIPLAGKKTVCQLAAGQAGFVPYLHVSSKCAGFLQVGFTVALWFQYSESDSVKNIALSVLENLQKQNWSRAHDDCIKLVDDAVSIGMRACFVVDRVQFLDEFSLSLIRECLKPQCQRSSRGLNRHLSTDCESVERRQSFSNSIGKICFLCVHESLYNEKSASDIAEDLSRSNRSISIPIIKLGEASEHELKQMFADCMDVELDDCSFELLAKSSRYFAGCFIERSGAIGTDLSTASWKVTTFGLSKDLKLKLSEHSMRKIKKIPLTLLRPEISMRFTLIFDELPPLFQTFLKVLCIGTRTEFYKLSRSVMWEVLNDLIASGIEAGEYSIVLDEMKEMCLIEVEDENEETVLSFQSPALAEIAFDVSTPAQVNSIAQALLSRLNDYELNDFRISLVMADLECQLNRKNSRIKSLLRQGLRSMMERSEIEVWPSEKVNNWKRIILDEIEESGCPAEQIFPVDCERHFVELPEVPSTFCRRLLLLKEFCPPIALGPMSRTFAAICRTTFHEFGFLNGYDHETVEKIVSGRKNAIHRYLRQTAIIEEFLESYSCSCHVEELDAERTKIMELITPAENDAAINRKVSLILDQISPSYISSRVRRLYSAVDKLRQESVPEFMINANSAIRRAYETLRGPKSGLNAVQEALMILATLNWNANAVPNEHRCTPYTTVANLRNKMFTRCKDKLCPSSDDDKETALGFEAFLITTALLDEKEKVVARLDCVKIEDSPTATES